MNIYLMEDFAKSIGVIIDWTSDNVVYHLQDLVGRYTTYEVAIKGASVGSGVIIAIASIVCGLLGVKKYRESNYGDDFGLYLSLIALFGIFVAVVIITPYLINLLN